MRSRPLYALCTAAAVLSTAASISFAGLLGISLIGQFPNLSYVSTAGSATSYNAAGQNFSMTASPIAIKFSALTPPRIVNPTGMPPVEVVAIAIQVNNSGGLIGGVPGDDLLVQGEVDADGNGSIDYAGILLTGEVLGYGFLDSGGPNDQYDFRFKVTGGLLAVPYFTGKDAGVTMVSEASDFADDFTVNFSGQAKGNIAPIPKINQPPVCAANGPYEAECAGGTTTITLDGTQSSDPDEGDVLTYSWSSNCPGAAIVGGDTATPTLSVNTSPGCDVTCEVTLTVSDGIAPPAHCTATVHIVDTNPPAIMCPGDVTQECSVSTAPAQTGTATAHDDCDPNATVGYTDSEAPGVCPTTSVITRTWTASDSCTPPNTSTCVQTITRVDTTPPVIITCPPNKTVTCAQGTGPAVTGSPTAQDNCDPSPTATFSDDSDPGCCPVSAIITRTWTVTDACGNHTTCTQIITVRDTTGPQIQCPPNKTVECGQSTKPLSTGKATATDSCDPHPSISYYDTVCGSCPKVIQRKWKATDACGNYSTCTQTITVVDTTPPSICCPPNKTVTCGQSTDPCWTGRASATDACDSCVEITYCDTRTGSCPGTISRVWKAKDNCGNFSTCTQTITITGAPPCPKSPYDWKCIDPSRWPVQSLQVGCGTYNSTQLVWLLSGKLPNGQWAGDDASARLAKYQIAAKLSLLNGSCSNGISDEVSDAQAFLCNHPPGSNPSGMARYRASCLKDDLECYVNSRPCNCRDDCD